VAGSFTAQSQDNFYDISTIRDIRIHFSEQNWKHVLDSIFQNEGDEGRVVGDITIDGTSFRNVGVRYKGYSSWNIDEMKNPFNIEMDYSIKNQNYMGYTKIKLSNVIHDPSFIREVLAYEIAGKYMPASRAGYANLYINDSLIGLYTNVEAVDKKFIEKHFSSAGNSFFKGEPETLKYPFGQNANLAYTHGEDSSGYIPYYKIESDYGWNKLFHFIYVLNEETDSVETILNTDQALWMHAFNYVLLNLDSYIGYSQNFYLYEDENGRFNPVVWDLNMSFGSFRESDGSDHFLGLTIPEMKTLDPLQHLTFSISPRPLMTNLFRNDRYRKMYLAHMRTIVKENFSNNSYYLRGEELQKLIDTQVRNDPYKFYSYDDFRDNLTNIVGGTASMIQYPGIRDLMEARIAYLDTFPGFHGEPTISDISQIPDHPRTGEDIWISAKVEGSVNVYLGYRSTSNGIFLKTVMYDDGNHHDGASGDKIFGAGISASGNIIQYYLYAENDTAAVFSPERAETEFYSLQPMISQGDLVINEIMIAGTISGSENGGWIELCNTTNEELNLKDYRLSDDFSNPAKWQFPDTVIKAKSYLIIWTAADNPPSTLQSNFNLSTNGGELILSDLNTIFIDSVNYGQQVQGKSVGRYPNGYGSFTYMLPSFSEYNYTGTTPESGFILFPNPAITTITLEIRNVNKPVAVRIYNAIGQVIMNEQYVFTPELIPVITQTIDISGFSRGLYFVQVTCNNMINTKKFVIK
jgi:hypothetical protein